MVALREFEVDHYDLWSRWGTERKWPKASFDALIGSPDHLGLRIASVRYRNVLKTLETVGHETTKRIGIAAATVAACAPKGKARSTYLGAVEVWMAEHRRTPSSESARGIANAVTPGVLGHRGRDEAMDDLGTESARLQQENQKLREENQRLRGTIRELRAKIRNLGGSGG